MSHREEAQELLRSPLLQEIREDMVQDLFEQWTESKTVDEREEIFHKVHAVNFIHELLIEKVMEKSK